MEQLLMLLKCSALSGAAVLGITLLRPVLGRRYQARWRCVLWLALALVLLLPLLPPAQRWSAAAAETAPIRIEVPPAAPIVIEAPAASLPPSGAAGQTGGEALPPAAPAVPSAGAPAVSKGEKTVRISLSAALRMIWLAGVGVFALYCAVSTALFCRRTVRWSRPAAEAVQRQMAETARELGLRRPPALIVSGYVKSPMVIGLFRHRLVLPAEDYAARELRFILRHELIHLKRGDLWYKLILLAANGVHWFNPLAYLLVREAEADLELTCDDAVLAGADQETRKAYSETLLASLHRQGGTALSTHFYGGVKTVKERFQNILAGGGRKRGIALLCAVLLLLAAAGFAVALTEQRPAPLAAEELSAWQEKLSEPGWNGLLTHMYGSPERISLLYVLGQGAGIDHELSDAERAAAHDAFFSKYDGRTGDAYTEAFGEPWENRITGIYAADLEAYLQEYTGLRFEELSHTRQWNYLAEYDSYYILNASTDTLRMEVLSGERQGDTVRLTLRREQEDWNRTVCERAGIPWEDSVLTVADGKVVSHANPLYAGAEAAAEAVMAQTAEAEGARVLLNQPLSLRMACRAETGDYCEWQLTLRLVGGDGEARYSSVRMLTRVNGDTETLETTVSGLPNGRDYMDYNAMGYTFEDYVRYRYDYGLTLSARSWSWPVSSTPFFEDFPAGKAEWAKEAEETAAQWLSACGDSLTAAETVYESLKKATGRYTTLYDYTADYQDVVLRCTTAAGRQVLVLLNYLTPKGREIPGCWSVAGCRVETGEALPEPAADYRAGSAQLRYTADGEERQVPASLVSGGTGFQGDAYTDHAWNIRIPLTWTRTPVYAQEGFEACWYPAAADQGDSCLKISRSKCSTAESFYQSYLPQYENTGNNGRSFAEGTATAAWAGGTQALSGQTRYTESLWVDGAQGPFEVLWTSTDQNLMAEMRAAAMTFTLAGEDTPTFGEMEPATLTGHFTYFLGFRAVRQEEDTDWIQAGTYLVLTPKGWAFRLEDYFMENAERVRDQMNLLSSRYPAPFGEIRLDSLKVVQSMDSGFSHEEDSPCMLFICQADWAMSVPAGTAPSYSGGTVDQDGYWHGDGTSYLVLEGSYKRGCITKSFLMSSSYAPSSEEFRQELQMVESGLSSAVRVTEHDSHPAIFYDLTAGQLFAIHSSPLQTDGSQE